MLESRLLIIVLVASACALLGCRSDPPSAPDTREPAPPEPSETCSARLMREGAIDVAPEPAICPALAAAWDLLGAPGREAVRELKIVRDARGPCGERCPDLASALMSDAALAYYRVGSHELHVNDATFDGPRWRGGDPAPEAIRAYLDALGLADWAALVERVRRLDGVALPAAVPPEGDPLVLDQIVRRGPAVLMGSEISLRDLIVHELGHAVLLRADGDSVRIEAWATLSGWRERVGPGEDKPADGYVKGSYANELPIVASRLLLGLPRGNDSLYLPRAGGGLATGYAAFDPIEDHAESFRLAHADPLALARASPAKLLVLADDVTLADPKLLPFLRAGVAALLADDVEPLLAMQTLYDHRKLLKDHAAAIADLSEPSPPPVPPDLHPEIRALLEPDELRLVLGDDLVLRPSDAAVLGLYARLEQVRRQREALQQGIDSLEPPD